MENFIIVLISIGFVIYNIYRNFQKEVEKSKARRPHTRPQPVPIEKTPTREEPIKYKEVKKSPVEPLYIPEIPAEVIAAQERRRQKNIEKPILVTRMQETVGEKNNIEFDLRQAIIQSAILERPYK